MAYLFILRREEIPPTSCETNSVLKYMTFLEVRSCYGSVLRTELVMVPELGKICPPRKLNCVCVCVFLQEFIEELLSPPFGGLVAFVKEAEALIERGQAERLRGEEGLRMGWMWWGEGKGEGKRKLQGCRLHEEGEHQKGGCRVRTAVPWGGPSGIRHHLAVIFFLLLSARVTQLIRGFGSSWKSSVESLSQDVMRSFTNFRNGTSIIQVTCDSWSPLPPHPITGLPSSSRGSESYR